MRGRPRLTEEQKEQNKADRREVHANTVSGGREPNWEYVRPKNRTELNIAVGAAFNWYAMYATETQQKHWFLEILTKHKYNNKAVEALNLLPEKDFVPYGGLAKMFLRGAPLPKSYQEKFMKRVKKLLPEAQKLVNRESKKRGRKPKTEQIIPVRKTDPKYVEMATRIDNMLENHMLTKDKEVLDFSLNEWLKSKDANAEQVHKLKQHLKNLGTDMQLFLTKDEETLEAYPFITRPIAKHIDEFVRNLNATAENYVPGKKMRKARRKKIKTPEEILKYFKCLEFDKVLKLKSIDPENILGASQLWIFNTKYRKLGVFNAKTDAGLEVRRTMIENYDEETSIAKKVRKPLEIVPKLITAGKVELRKLLPGIRAVEQKLKSRINEDILLVRVIK
jgi:hypothetical protein